MSDDNTCDLCSAPATGRCGRCHQAYYCGAACQRKDWFGPHQEVCEHVDNLNLDDLALHLEHFIPSTPEELAFHKAGKEILDSQNLVEARVWIGEYFDSSPSQLFRRAKVRHQKKVARKQTTHQRRKTRKSNHATRQAKNATRAKQQSQQAYQKRQQAAQREQQAQDTTFNTPYVI